MPRAAGSVLQAQAYSVLLDIVSDGALKAGRSLDIPLLASRSGLPAALIDDALSRLAMAGLVDRIGGQRYVVAACSSAQARRLLVQQGDRDAGAIEDQVGALDTDRRVVGLKIIAQGREACSLGALSRLAEADLAFHRFIDDLAVDADFGARDDDHWLYLRRVFCAWWAHADESQAARAWDEHAEILDALTRGDAVDAGHLVRRHVVSSVEVVGRFTAN